MSCLLVFGGGHRGDVIRNMTLEEWKDRRIEKAEKNLKVTFLQFDLIAVVQKSCSKGPWINFVE